MNYDQSPVIQGNEPGNFSAGYPGVRAHNKSTRPMNANALSGPGIRIPPPLFYLVALVMGMALDHFWPLSCFAGSSRYIVGSVVIVVSVLIMPPVLLSFRRAATPFDVRKAASALITDGPYKFSRNPTYLSLTLLYLGLGVVLDSGWVLILVIPVILLVDLWVVRKEERHLEASFGEQYLRYKATVRRWL